MHVVMSVYEHMVHRSLAENDSFLTHRLRVTMIRPERNIPEALRLSEMIRRNRRLEELKMLWVVVEVTHQIPGTRSLGM